MRPIRLILGLLLVAGPLSAQAAELPAAPAPLNPADVPAIPRIDLPTTPPPGPAAPRPLASSDTSLTGLLSKPAPLRQMGDVDELPVIREVPVWYFPKGKLKAQAVVKFQAIIDTVGRVEPSSLKILSLSDTTFAAAARFTLLGARYQPATWRHEPVRVWVIQAVRYAGDHARRCEMDAVTPMLPTKC